MQLLSFPRLLLLTVLFFCTLQEFSWAERGRSGQIVFNSPEEALQALVNATKAEDLQQMIAIFGKNSKDFFLTGDPVSDAKFLRRLSYRLSERAELFSVVNLSYENEQWLLVRFGIEGWNMRIPLVNRGTGWSFATEYATDSNLEMRISLNQVATIDTLRALVKAQKTYKAVDWNGDGVLEYAQKFISTPNIRDGLYWPEKTGTPESPIDGLVGRAILDGYHSSSNNLPTYGGYIYKMLTAQGPQTRGGKKLYLKDNHLTEGFAILAYPVKWRSSGNLSFLVGLDGQVWQKDLGSRTSSIASKISSIDLDSLWIRADPMLGGKNSRTNW